MAEGPTFMQYAGTTVLSGVASRLAASHQSGTLRIPIRSGVDSIWNDIRMWLGLGGAIATMAIPREHSFIRGAAFTVGLGAATSIAATEQVRSVTVATLQRGGAPMGLPVAQPQQVAPVAPRQLAAPVPVAPQVQPVQQVRPVATSGYGVW